MQVYRYTVLERVYGFGITLTMIATRSLSIPELSAELANTARCMELQKNQGLDCVIRAGMVFTKQINL